MDIKKMSNFLVWIGAIGLAISFIWGCSDVNRGSSFQDIINHTLGLRQIYVSTTPIPYFFWVSFALLGIGIIIKYSQKDTKED